MVPEGLRSRKPRGEFAVVTFEALIFGMLALGGLSSERGRGDCGGVCQTATPYLVVAAALCVLSLVGVVIVWLVGRSGHLLQPQRIAMWIGAGLFASVFLLLLAVMMIPGAHVD